MKLHWLVLFVVLFSMTSASAERRLETVKDVAIIQDGAGSARILFKVDKPTDAESMIVAKARLRLNLTGDAESRQLRLRVHPVTKEWRAADVDWYTGWTRPGGDFDERLYTTVDVDLSAGSTTAMLDLTSMVKEAREHGASLHGFLVTVAPSEDRAGLRVEDLARLTSLDTSKLELIYRKYPNRRRAG